MAAIRLLPFGSADGPTNMAADEAMLETASNRGLASLRFYTWTEPTTSLGYFQSSSAVQAVSGSLSWVRRSTGGAAIVHHHELTYALALPDRKEWRSNESWICRFHKLLSDVLAERGVESHLVACGEERKLGDVLCFLHQTPGDLLVGGSKIAGSAQRKRKGALLQHGSLLLGRSEFAPTLPGINDLVGWVEVCEAHEAHHPLAVGLAVQAPLRPTLQEQDLAESLGTHIPVEPGDWTSDELRRMKAIRSEKYANAAWNEKR